MGGTSSSNQHTQSTQQTTPYGPAAGGVQNIANQASDLTNGAGSLSSGQDTAIGQLEANAQSGNPYAAQIGGVAGNLLSGGGATNQAPMVNSAYAGLQNTLNPYTSASFLNPATNPGTAGIKQSIFDDINGQVNGMFAANDRYGSGANQGAWARAATNALAPIEYGQYNQNVAAQQNAANSLYNGGNTTAGILSGYNQQGLQNQQAGIGAADQALQARDSSANAYLNANSLRRSIPTNQLGSLSGILGPLAQAFGTQNGQSNSQGSQDMSGAQQFATIAGGLRGLFGGGGGGWGAPSGGG